MLFATGGLCRQMPARDVVKTRNFRPTTLITQSQWRCRGCAPRVTRRCIVAKLSAEELENRLQILAQSNFPTTSSELRSHIEALVTHINEAAEQRYRIQVSDLNAEISRLQDENHTLKTDAEMPYGLLQNEKGLTERLKAEVAKWEIRCDGQTKVIGDLREELAEARKEYDERLKLIDRSDIDWNDMQEERDALRAFVSRVAKLDPMDLDKDCMRLIAKAEELIGGEPKDE